ncbi:MAG: metal ABC transporter ATP-binding protein [Rhodospirillaceae bacterium]|jgi:hypothetical protein|nr:metal ABC transporter ATP-binding protein [Rhodospirillales bacterium]MBT4117363.1 metal ABC transporter ATP-binding protein [Rhodospirillaceae bacterium]MBT5840362.1 metal ABC transporter ATP-binding protein [Rhodospirillaceae bacterium]MBT7235723.1 metal ABC transporter ATP-binding protein [Rhodospirillaceae bacterium]MBT7570410.1 metal ABC transporter ATP-binding protein [Rhodospirillaceae bacterium]
MNLRTFPIFAGLVALGACATQPDEIGSAYVSELQYHQYNCNQLGAEAARVSGRANELFATLKKTADNDEAQMAAGLILLWPILFFLEGGDGPAAQEYARLKGEYEAVEKVAIKKECGLEFAPIVPPEVEEKPEDEENT